MSIADSVSSSGSKIRQFGLYRTIDARTEDFLQSSRKRQIRQGCACAAISTAITVTVVVTVILVYEYSINSESNVNKKMLLKPNWIGLMNESDITSFGSKFNKKINFDTTTLKLLPILLKALNNNRYLEKILEDYSSSSSPYEEKDSTEATFTGNIFSDSKKWLKMPTSRHYTVDTRTSPLMHWKTPTQRLEYLTKIRKIRDYQRMLNYFDKMINIKLGSNQKKDFQYTEKPFIGETVPMKKDKKIKIQQLYQPRKTINNVKEFKIEKKDVINSCKCPKNLSQLLTKLIVNIQDLVPHMISNKLGVHHPCKNGTKPISQIKTPRKEQRTTSRVKEFPTTTSIASIRKNSHKLTTKSTPRYPKHFTSLRQISTVTSTTLNTSTRATTTRTTLPATTKTTFTDKSTKNIKSQNSNNRFLEDSTIQMPSITNTRANYHSLKKNILDYDYFVIKPTDAPRRSEITKPPYTKRSTTEMFVPIKFVDSSKEQSYTDKQFDAYTVDPSFGRAMMPLYKEDDYDEYFVTTPKSATFEHLDVHSVELMKSKMISSSHNKYQNNLKKHSRKSNHLTYHPIGNQNDLDLSAMRKMTDFIYIPPEKYISHKKNKKDFQEIAKEWKYNREPKHTVTSFEHDIEPTLRPSSTITSSVESSILSTTKFLETLKNGLKITNFVPDLKMNQLEMKLNLEQASGENVGEEEFQYEDGFKQTDRSTGMPYKYSSNKFKNSTKKVNVEKKKEKITNPWDLLKNKSKIVATTESLKSMLPAMRPIYLEVQRNNEWRQDDHQDYDFNFNNNIFDLPNIN